MEEATFLTRFARSVTVVHRRDELRASAVMADRARSNPKIRFEWDSEVDEVLGEDTVRGLRLRSTTDGSTRELAVTGMFVAIGHDPRSDLVRGQVDVDDEGYVLVDHPHTRRRRCPASSPPATWSTATTARRSPPPGPAAPAALDAERWLADQVSPAETDHGAGVTSADQSAGTELEGEDNVLAERSDSFAPVGA